MICGAAAMPHADSYFRRRCSLHGAECLMLLLILSFTRHAARCFHMPPVCFTPLLCGAPMLPAYLMLIFFFPLRAFVAAPLFFRL